MYSGGTFKFGAPSSSSSADSAPKNSYSGSFVSSVSPSDSVSNVGSMLQSVTINSPVVYSGGGAAGGDAAGGGAAGGSSDIYVTPRYYGSEKTYLHHLRYDFATFRGEIKTPLTFVSGSVIKCHHANGEFADFVSEAHMQYLYVVDDILTGPDLKDSHPAEKVTALTTLNRVLFEEHEMVSTNWGPAKFYRSFKDVIVKPVVDDLYNGTLSAVFFKKAIDAPDEPLSKAVFEYWLAK
jgi:hypothetical protein